MNNNKMKIAMVSGVMLGLLTMSCSDSILEETPRATYEPSFFRTETGVRGGITSMYGHLRSIFGQAYFYNTTETGTDEATYGQSADQNFLIMDVSGQGNITPQDSRADILWGAAFSNINTANGVIANAVEVGISPTLTSEANFFRAFDYFMLVQTFGGVPLDLGAGMLEFNTNPTRTSVRNTVPEVYTQVIFPDLITAVENLPAQPRVTGGVTQTLARLYLAKAYLTYAWWLENPNNIPTYPETNRTDPDGNSAQYYFQQAYDISNEAINNPGPFALQNSFYEVNNAANDRNSEILFYSDHTETSEFYNGSSLTYANGGGSDNFAGWMLTWNYTSLRSASSSGGEYSVASVQREDSQFLGRPWVRMAPTVGVLTNTFANKSQDSRYDGTFTSVYRGNWPKAGVEESVLYNANGLQVAPGNAILTFLDEQPESGIQYPDGTGDSNIGAGVMPGRSDFVIGPEDISRIVYPGLWKLGPYRTNSGDGLGQPNAASTRPFNIAKFSELYFIAAEALVKGAAPQGGMSARDLINVIRARAGVWTFDNNDNESRNDDFSDQLIAETPTAIDINYILAERSREYYGEGYRWYDLIRTQKWAELASTYQIAGTQFGDHDAQTISRDIQPYLYLRPIPQGQLDALDMSAAELSTYQNPGY